MYTCNSPTEFIIPETPGTERAINEQLKLKIEIDGVNLCGHTIILTDPIEEVEEIDIILPDD